MSKSDAVREIATYKCVFPARRVWAQAGMPSVEEERLLVRVETENGRTGWGEATALAQWGGTGGQYYGETPGTVEEIIHGVLSRVLLGAEASSPGQVMRELEFLLIGHPYAKAAIEMALQDLRAQALGVPVYEALGGAARDSVWVGHMLSLMDDDEVVNEATRAVDEDEVSAFQVKGGRDPMRDARIIRRLRDSLSETVFLRLDANKGYGCHPKTVSEAVRRVSEAGVDAIEQPGASIEAMAAARAAATVTIIADESCWQPCDVLELWRADAADAVSVYVAKAGGMQRAREVAHVADALGWPCDLNGSLETGIGTAASMHVALAAPNAVFPSIISVPGQATGHLTSIVGRYWEDDVAAGGFSYQGGRLRIDMEAPGLGITVDLEAVQRYAVNGIRRSAAVT